jgi:predicted site-specific integrase-resolvase
MHKANSNTNKVEPAQPLDSPATFARFIGVSAQCVRNWCHEGIIPLKIHAGRIIRFEREAAIHSLNKREGGAVKQ